MGPTSAVAGCADRGGQRKMVGRTAMANQAENKLSFDAYVLDVHLTGLQAEVEAKLRRVKKFREQMHRIDAAGASPSRDEREKVAQALIAQVEEMLKTNLLVRETLQELLQTAHALLEDVRK